MPNEADRHQKILEEHLKREGLAVETYRDGENGREAVLAHRWEAIEDDEDRSLYSGDEGTCVASVVGALEYNNERVSITFLPDGCDGGPDVQPLSDLRPID